MAAREAEAAGDEYTTIEHCGVKLRIPTFMPSAVLDILMDGGRWANRRALREIVGRQQWQLLVDAGMKSTDEPALDAKVSDLLGN